MCAGGRSIPCAGAMKTQSRMHSVSVEDTMIGCGCRASDPRERPHAGRGAASASAGGDSDHVRGTSSCEIPDCTLAAAPPASMHVGRALLPPGAGCLHLTSCFRSHANAIDPSSPAGDRAPVPSDAHRSAHPTIPARAPGGRPGAGVNTLAAHHRSHTGNHPPSLQSRPHGFACCSS